MPIPQTAVAGTLTLWVVSATGACVLAIVLTAGSLSSRPPVWLAARTVVNVTRGVPTSILVVAAGILALRFGGPVALPALYPGTHPGFQHVAWMLAIALAFGSAGHLAEVFRGAYLALGQARLDELTLLGLPRLRQLAVVVGEAALVALPATGARLVHHLHNTAFAALFPVVEVFGVVLSQAHSTFRVIEAVVAGAAIYVVLSGAIWVAFKSAEAALRHGRALVRAPRRRTAT